MNAKAVQKLREKPADVVKYYIYKKKKKVYYHVVFFLVLFLLCTITHSSCGTKEFYWDFFGSVWV